MNVSGKKRNRGFSWRKHSSLAVSLGSLLVGLTLVTGCTMQKTEIKEPTPLLAQPQVDRRLALEDFGFPSQAPKLSSGKMVFQNNCASCHAVSYWQQPKVQNDLTYTTPIDIYLMLTTGKSPEVTHASTERRQLLPATHPKFREKLSRDQRWEAIFYARYLAGNADVNNPALAQNKTDVSSVFGGNCGVCHGKRGFADGPLHSGKASSHELASAKIHDGVFEPPPANFHDYKRMYNRTDAQLFKYVAEGVYPSAMPPWAGNVDKEYGFVFDDKLIWQLVRHVRTFGYDNDLPEDTPVPPGPIPGRVASVKNEKPAVNQENQVEGPKPSNTTPIPSTSSPGGESHL